MKPDGDFLKFKIYLETSGMLRPFWRPTALNMESESNRLSSRVFLLYKRYARVLVEICKDLKKKKKKLNKSCNLMIYDCLSLKKG